MKTTIKINLSSQIFTLDEDAYQMLKDYLDAISKRFRDMEEGNEIITDIESRIAELFQSRVSEKKEVITMEDVKEVIDIMGHPEDFDEGDEAEYETGRGKRREKKTRKYYRDPDNAIFGGVASGLAAYFGIEVWLMRLLWVIFFLATAFGVVTILYIVLWIAVPKAKTASEKLEMKGEKVTVENIEKTIKEEYVTVKENVKEGYKKVKDSKELRKTKNVLDEIGSVIGKILLVFLKIILAIIGVTFIISGLAVLAGLSIGFFFRNALFPVDIFGSEFLSYQELFGVLGDPTNLTFISIALFFVIAIPLIALVYAGIKMLFRFEAKDRVIGLTALVLWILSLIFLISMAAFEGWHFNDYGRSSSTHDLQGFPSDTLFVAISDDPGIEGFNDRWYFTYDETWHVISGHDKVYGKIELDIEPAGIDDFEISVRKNSQGRTRAEAAINAEKLDYQWRQEGADLILDPYFSLEKPNKWRVPGTRVTIMVPLGKYIRLDRNTRYFLDNVESVDDERYDVLAGNIWVMTEEGLGQVD
jgi:phage shock protein PspC (stress-responsive transcriptional regulator)